MTSLKEVYQFELIADYVLQAKEQNPHLIVSIDPGYDYTKNHWKTLKKILPIADYVFLSRIELSNISSNLGLSLRSKALDLGDELISSNAHPQILVVKGKSSSVLISLINKRPFIRTYYHRKLFFTRILNDTGAGDAYAGGFIAAQLSPYMLSHQPAPIQLATIAACERLQSLEWPPQLKQKAAAFFQKNMKDEMINRKQWLKIHFEFLKNPIWNIILGILLGLASTAIWEWLKSL